MLAIEQSTYAWLARFNEAEKSVVLPIEISTSDPKWEIVIGDRYAPAPILWPHVGNGYTALTKATCQELRQSFSITARIHLLVFAKLRRKSA